MLENIKKMMRTFWGSVLQKKILKNGSPLQNDFDLKYIKSIEIETFSFCNRQCWFCPNSFIDRHTRNIEMSEELYLQILKELAKINFSGTLSFSRYNEPLSQKELVLKRIRQARIHLPDATLTTNTNGDYLSKDYLDDLRDAGLNILNIQHYLRENEKFEADSVKKSFEKLSMKMETTYEVYRKQSNRIEAEFKYSGMKITARARDFRENGCTRGNSVETIAKVKRHTGCLIPYTAVFIDYNGQVMPCCNLRSDFPPHKRYVLGDCNSEKLSEIFNSKKTLNFRNAVKGNPPQLDICKSCNFCDDYEVYFGDLRYILEQQKA